MKDPVETFRSLFDDSMRLRLRSDVPVGVALSDGLDSASVMSSTVKSGYDHDLKAFTAISRHTCCRMTFPDRFLHAATKLGSPRRFQNG
ncbi:MAG: hypothetical protein D6781_04165 [Verrucomicrobia bacterium]|nr:MAG: hypothetical protein D6781_04165 [Verrucomicrobiota bacterium]